MVSTRQMANGSNNTQNQSTAVLESARLSIVTRQASLNYMLVNCPTIPPQNPRNLSPLSAVAAGPSTSSRQHQCNNGGYSPSQQELTGKTSIGGDTSNVTNTLSVLQLLDLPVEILSKIFSYIGYRKVGQLRLISHKMNGVCMDILNSTFSRLITQTYNRFHSIKSNMPRRESARRNHPLSCECDIIETCYMRLSLLQMTFGKHIERGHCCFFPGAILDEVYNILSYIRNTPRLERPYRVTDELFDLSTMAMEYFRDRIEATLPDIAYFNKDFFKLPTNTKRPALVASDDHSDSSSSSPPQSNMVLRKGIRKIKQGMKMYNNQLSVLRSELRTCKRKSSEQGKQIAEQQKLLAEQQKQTLEYANRLDENDKKNEEIARKFSTLLQELNKCKTELQYWRSKSPAIPICTSCGQKLAPILPPPEDFQALVNQGVKPEDIILNLNDETDTESDVSMNETNSIPVFVFPDKETTAKLLAVSTVSKTQNKRLYANTTSTTNTSNDANGSNCNCQGSDNHFNTVNTAATDADCFGDDFSNQPSEMTNYLNYARGSNIIRTTLTTSTNPSWYTQTIQQQQSKGISNNATATATKVDNSIVENCPIATTSAASMTVTNNNNVGNSNDVPCCTKLNFGSRSYRSVIVSPAMLSANKKQYEQQMFGTEQLCNAMEDGRSTAENANNAGIIGVDGVCDQGAISETNTETAIGTAGAVENVVSLQAISSHETKKARRVQKATRCLNGSGKRSK